MTFFKRVKNGFEMINPESGLTLQGFNSSGIERDFVIKELIITDTWEIKVQDSVNATELVLDSGTDPLILKDVSYYHNPMFGYVISNTDTSDEIYATYSEVCVYDSDSLSQPLGNPVVAGLLSIEAGATLSLYDTVSTTGYESIIPTIIHEDAVDIIMTDGVTTVTRETVAATNIVDIVSPLRNTNSNESTVWYEIKNNAATAKLIGYCGLLTSTTSQGGGGPA